MRWPWRKRARPESPQKAVSLRQLRVRYQRQRRMWTYVILSSVVLMLLFLPLSLLSVITPWTLAIPVTGIGFAISQSRRCRDIIHTLRQALITQQQIEKAQAQAEQRQAEVAAPQAAGGTREGEADAPQADAPERPDGRPRSAGGPGGNGRRTPEE